MTDTIPFARNAQGLIEGIDYPRKPTGEIDWRALLRPEHLYINREYKEELEARFNKKLKDIDVTKVDDKQLLILLAGIKELARLRGYHSVKQSIYNVGPEKAVCTCQIEFIGNFETGGSPVVFGDVGSASLYSVSGNFQLHLEAIAANRAFVRAVRNYLGVNIVGNDEFDPYANKAYEKTLKEGKPSAAVEDSGSPKGFQPFHGLEKLCNERKPKITFVAIQKRATDLVAAGKSPFVSDPAVWTSFADIPPRDVFTLQELINAKV